jgi:hypothetical protein
MQLIRKEQLQYKEYVDILQLLMKYIFQVLPGNMLNMELDLQSLFVLHVHSCTYKLRPRNPTPPSPHIWTHIRGPYWSTITLAGM